MTAVVTVVGSINMDLVIRSPKLPEPGETVIGRDLETIPGGKGANQAVAAARLGASVAMVGRLGSDVFAGQLKSNLAAAGVDVTFIREIQEAASGVALIVVDDSGQNSIVVASGANARLSPKDVEVAGEAIEAADVVVLQLEIPLETVHSAARLARQHGARVVLNPAPAQPLPAELLALVDVLVPNESETELLSGMPVDDLDEAAAAATNLLASGVEAVLLTLGERGALLAQDDARLHFLAFPVEEVVDTTAAGDAFVGGVASALAEGKSLAQAVPWGNASGALATTTAGAQPSLPTRQQVQKLLSQASNELLHGARM